MAKYRRIDGKEKVEAFQMTLDNLAHRDRTWPKWLKGLDENGRVALFTKDSPVEIVVLYPGVSAIVNILVQLDDWITKNKNGDIEAFTPDIFEGKFTPVVSFLGKLKPMVKK